MIVVMFEVELKSGKKEAYLKLAAQLQAELEQQEGLISLERFESIHNTNKMLSLQVWKDLPSIDKWRNNQHHKKVMHAGYHNIFENYTLRVLNNIRTYSKNERKEAPADINF